MKITPSDGIRRDLSSWLKAAAWTREEAMYLLADLEPTDHPAGLTLAPLDAPHTDCNSLIPHQNDDLEEYRRRIERAERFNVLLERATAVGRLKAHGEGGYRYELIDSAAIIEWAQSIHLELPPFLCQSGLRRQAVSEPGQLHHRTQDRYEIEIDILRKALALALKDPDRVPPSPNGAKLQRALEAATRDGHIRVWSSREDRLPGPEVGGRPYGDRKLRDVINQALKHWKQ